MASTLRVDKIWTLAEARALIATLQSHVRVFGFHVCLGGGVLNTGMSAKDLDLYFLPLDREDQKIDPKALLAFLTSTWGPGRGMSEKAAIKRYIASLHNDSRLFDPPINPTPEQDYPQMKGSPYTHKLKFVWSGLRIDVFIIGMREADATDTKAVSDEEVLNAIPGGSIMPEGMAPPASLLTLGEQLDFVARHREQFNDMAQRGRETVQEQEQRHRWITRRPDPARPPINFLADVGALRAVEDRQQADNPLGDLLTEG